MRDMTILQGMWPPSRRVVSRGLSLRTLPRAGQLQRPGAKSSCACSMTGRSTQSEKEAGGRAGAHCLAANHDCI